MLYDVELVVENGRLRRILLRRREERLPHVHDGQLDLPGTPFAQGCEELIHALLGPVFAAEPDGPAPFEVAHHDAVGMALADRDLVNADRLRLRLTGALELLAHVLHLQRLDGLPIEKVFLGHILDRGCSTATANVESKALGVERVVGEPVKSFLLHVPTTPAIHTAHIELKVDPRPPAGKVSHQPRFAVIPAAPDAATT